MLSTPEIMRQATGEPLNAQYFEEHLRRRYLDLTPAVTQLSRQAI